MRLGMLKNFRIRICLIVFFLTFLIVFFMALFFFSTLAEWVACVRSNFLVLCYLHDVKNILQLHDLATGAHLKTFPLEVGSIVGYSGQKKDTEIFYQFTSFLSPGKFVVLFCFFVSCYFPFPENSIFLIFCSLVIIWCIGIKLLPPMLAVIGHKKYICL